ncbi:transporter [bacterium]|nr:transporter [bacterium]
MNRSKLFLTVLVMVCLGGMLHAQEPVHLFQAFQYDAPIAGGIYGEGGLLYVNYTDADVSETIIAARGGIPFGKKMELIAQLAYVNITPKNWDAMNGMADIGVYGRYNFYKKGSTAISAGPFLTLPIGSEDVGQGNLNYGAYAAARHGLRNGIQFTANIGIEFYETWEWHVGGIEETYTNQLLLGFGTIVPIGKKTHIVGEFFMKDDMDYSVLSCGVDQKLGPGHLRVGIGIGLDDGAPDLMVAGCYGMAI